MRVSPSDFRDAFSEVAAIHAAELASLWDQRKLYTAFVRSTLVKEIGERLNLRVYSATDYYWLDAIMYEAADTEHFLSHETYAKSISIAVEHEHLAKGTHVEMNKLQLFNVPLKVLITYDRRNRMTESLLKMYSKIAKDADVFGDFASLRRILVIIGDKDSGAPHWRYFSFDGETFPELR